jgi:hypothetical protein
MSSARLVLSIAALHLCGALADLIFSPPALVSVTSPAESAALLPMVPEHFFGLARPGNASAAPLLFGAHGPGSWDVSSDGGASWARMPGLNPLGSATGFANQTNQLVPLFAAGGLHPEAYHDLGSVRGAVTRSGWSRSNVTTVRAAPGGGLSFTFDALAATTFSGVPAPGLNTTFDPELPKVYGFFPLAGGGYVCVAAIVWAGAPLSVAGLAPQSLLAFVSADSYVWRFSSVVANFSSFPGMARGPNEADIAYRPDGKTLALVFRMDGHNDCSSGFYRNYYSAESADGGASWSFPAELPGLGCVRPKLLHVPGGPLVLSGGRNCLANTRDNMLWTSATGAPNAWANHSISYQHNRLWRGGASYLFGASVNGTAQWETLSYTSVVRTGPDSFAVFYNKCLNVNTFPPWPSANFVMQVLVK